MARYLGSAHTRLFPPSRRKPYNVETRTCSLSNAACVARPPFDLTPMVDNLLRYLRAQAQPISVDGVKETQHAYRKTAMESMLAGWEFLDEEQAYAVLDCSDDDLDAMLVDVGIRVTKEEE